MSVNLGDRVKHRVHGFTGIVTVRAEHLYGCNQVFVKPEKLDKDGKEAPGIWIDEPWADLVKAGVHSRTPTFVTEKNKVVRRGGAEGEALR